MSNTQNNNPSLFEQVKNDAVAKDKSVAHYLTQAQQRAALTRLPNFEQTTTDDIALLKRDINKLYRLISIAVVLLLAIALIGGLLCLL